MPYAASFSTDADLDSAVNVITSEIRQQLGGHRPNLCFFFVSHSHVPRFDELSAVLQEKLQASTILGCSGEMIVGGDREIEEGPALSVWAAFLPEARVTPFHVEFTETPDGWLAEGFPAELTELATDARAIFALGDPYSTPMDSVIERFADELPGVPLLGGMASGGGPGSNRVFLNGASFENGVVVAVLQGGPRVHSVVSQGCRPIGPTYVVTRSERNVVFELGGKSPIERLQEFLPELPAADQRLVQRGLHLGVAMSEYKDTFGRGDFLISNILGADQQLGAIAIGNLVRVGQTVQFHVRDAKTADEDLRHLLNQHRSASFPATQAALLFTCNGRGTRLFDEPNHDAAVIRRILGTVPVAGFFAQGELGPVGSNNYIHGFTASIACFEGS
jgi:small ligand-binding sensory domain FIST